eukprot:gene33608-43147_t
MNRVIRQVFGTTRPGDLWGDLLTFDRLITKPVVHIVYWFGLGLLSIFGLGWTGIMIGTGLKDASVMGWLLSFGLSVIGWLGVMLAILVWRSFCEFYMAVMNIADDLRHLRLYQDKLTMPAAPVAAAVPVAAAAEPEVAAGEAALAASSEAEPKREGNIIDDPFF